MRTVLPLVMLLAALWGCSEQTDPVTPQPGGGGGQGGDGGGSGGCQAGQLELDGQCVDAGLPAEGCPPGTALDEASTCQPAGVPADRCGHGFVSDGDHGCVAVLPAAPCGDGLMALPGETTCREVAPCQDGSWGDIPVEADTQYVDAGFAGGSNDGSQANPWTTVQEAVDAANPGAIVAVAAGSYPGEVTIAGKSVRLWGRCPAAVELVGTGSRVLRVGSGADGTEVRGLALTGHVSWSAVQVSGAAPVLFERVWLHDTDGSRGMDIVYASDGGTSVTLRDSLLERTRTNAIMVWGTDMTVERSVVRDTQPSLTSGVGRGFNVAVPEPGKTASASIDRSVFVGNGEIAVAAFGATLDVSDTLIADTGPTVPLGESGYGLLAHDGSGLPAAVTVQRTVIERSHAFGISVRGSDVTLDAVVVRDVAPEPASGHYGYGIQLRDGGAPPIPASAVIDFSLVDRPSVVGLAAYSGTSTLTGVRIRDVQPTPQAPDWGIGALLDVEEPTARTAASFEGSVLERCRGVALLGFAADVSLARSVIQGTRAATQTEALGYGIEVINDDFGSASFLELNATLVDDNITSGIRLWGSEAVIDRSVVSRTASGQPLDRQGDGIAAMGWLGQASHLTLRASVLREHHQAGVHVEDSTATIEASVVADIAARPGDGLFGDGITVTRVKATTSVAITSSRIASASRSGMSSFGASSTLERSLLWCNPIALIGESYLGAAPSFEDGGDNLCGCDDGVTSCKMLSASLAPPEPLHDPLDIVPEPGDAP